MKARQSGSAIKRITKNKGETYRLRFLGETETKEDGWMIPALALVLY